MTLKPSEWGKYITPFNLVLVAIAATALYAVVLSAQNWMTLRALQQSAPGHVIEAATKTSDLTVTMFYDYRCPFCYQIDPVIRAAAEADGKVELLYKFLPALGDESEHMARMAYAAGKQGKFLAVHDYFMKGAGRTYDDDEIKTMSDIIGLDYEQFLKDTDSAAAAKKVQDNMDLALSLGAYSTPTIVFGKDVYVPSGEMPDQKKFLELFAQARQKQ
ncbi:MAG: DsbA family protein [Rhodospirillales bacterium]|nr:DsbA family protein [Rhodospirillales bacterium]MCB9965624.1 DsbA family protein [Rhodospirillales bacterium]MCB9973047.1 DsbA family protein [Rhodospirillales bacterium]